MKGCQVSKWFVGKCGIKISRIFQGMSTSGSYVTYAVKFSITDIFKFYRK